MCDLSVLIVTYNNEADIAACLDSVAAIEGLDVQTIVLDNASGDATFAAATAHSLRAHVIALETNVGFGSGMNRAAADATGTNLLLLNPDAVLERGAAERLVELTTQRPDAAVYGGLTMFTDGRLNPNTVRRLPSLRAVAMFATGLSMLSGRITDFEQLPLPTSDEVAAVPMLTGSLMLIPHEVWDQLGGFDERFFMYAEDTDFCARIADAGLEILLDPLARIVHDGGASTPDGGRKAAMMMSGRATYIRLRWTGIKRRVGLGLLWFGVAIRALSGRLHPKARRWAEAWRLRDWWFPGYGDGRPNLPPG
ncbi:MAG: glycosyltransferase family 2 protein [Actinomycetota bacterium]|nr:glycosyltransferase family 2 protein [Actinomycetota bacterium]